MEKYLKHTWLRWALFLTLSILLVLPNLVVNRFHMDIDGWFHLSRIYELAYDLSQGKFFPDVSYISFNNQAYPVNFFYPYLINYPTAGLLLLVKDPVRALLIMNIVYHLLGLAIAYDTYYRWRGNRTFAVVFALLYVFSNVTLNYRLLNLGTYHQQIAYFFLPWALMGIYQVIRGDRQKWWKRLVLAVVLVTYSHLLTLLLLVAYAGLVFFLTLVFSRDSLSWPRIRTWLVLVLHLLVATAIFVFPFLEQRGANHWLPVPMLNILEPTRLSETTNWGLMTWLQKGLNFENFLIFLCLLALAYAAYHQLLDRPLLLCMGGILLVNLLQSAFIPYEVLEKFSLVSLLQHVDRLDIFLGFAMSLIVAYVGQIIWDQGQPVLKGAISLILVFHLVMSIGHVWLLGKGGILPHHLTDFQRSSYLATKENIETGLAHPNFGYFDAQDYSAHYRINGFWDYRPLEAVIDENKQVSLEQYEIPNGETLHPYVNFPADFMRTTNDFIENAVYFDQTRVFGHWSQEGLSFRVQDIPTSTQVLTTPVSYLKGFVAKDQTGKVLTIQKNAQGLVTLQTQGAKEISLTYHKTLLHKLGIGLTLAYWLGFLLWHIWPRGHKPPKASQVA